MKEVIRNGRILREMQSKERDKGRKRGHYEEQSEGDERQMP